MKDSSGSHLGYFSATGTIWDPITLPGASFFQSNSARKYKLFGFGDYFYALITTDVGGSDVNKLYRALADVNTSLGAWQEFDMPSNPDRPGGQSVGGWRNFLQSGVGGDTRYFLFGYGGKYAYSSNLSSWTIGTMPKVDNWDKSAAAGVDKSKEWLGNKVVVVGSGMTAAFCGNPASSSPVFVNETMNLQGAFQQCWGLSHDGTNFIAMQDNNFSVRVSPSSTGSSA
jgi:hypothetical protein